jgi:short-subunit dehydrogenase
MDDGKYKYQQKNGNSLAASLEVLRAEPVYMLIVVTGGSSGIGYSVGQRLISIGHDVVAVSRTQPPADLRCQWVQADLSEPDAAEVVAAQVASLNAIIHCAGACQRSAVVNTAPETIRAMFQLNVVTPILLTRALTPALAATGGCVVGVSSLAGRIGSPGNAVYSATKFALDGYLEAVAYELAHVGVRTRVVVPLYAKTPFMSAAAAAEPEPTEPFATFEHAARARLDASLESAPPEALNSVAETVVAAAVAPGTPWFDRVVVGETAALEQHHHLGPVGWYDHFAAQFATWLPDGKT